MKRNRFTLFIWVLVILLCSKISEGSLLETSTSDGSGKAYQTERQLRHTEFIDKLGIHFLGRPKVEDMKEDHCACKTGEVYNQSDKYENVSGYGYENLIKMKIFSYVHDWANEFNDLSIRPKDGYIIKSIATQMIKTDFHLIYDHKKKAICHDNHFEIKVFPNKYIGPSNKDEPTPDIVVSTEMQTKIAKWSKTLESIASDEEFAEKAPKFATKLLIDPKSYVFDQNQNYMVDLLKYTVINLFLDKYKLVKDVEKTAIEDAKKFLAKESFESGPYLEAHYRLSKYSATGRGAIAFRVQIETGPDENAYNDLNSSSFSTANTSTISKKDEIANIDDGFNFLLVFYIRPIYARGSIANFDISSFAILDKKSHSFQPSYSEEEVKPYVFKGSFLNPISFEANAYQQNIKEHGYYAFSLASKGWMTDRPSPKEDSTVCKAVLSGLRMSIWSYVKIFVKNHVFYDHQINEPNPYDICKQSTKFLVKKPSPVPEIPDDENPDPNETPVIVPDPKPKGHEPSKPKPIKKPSLFCEDFLAYLLNLNAQLNSNPDKAMSIFKEINKVITMLKLETTCLKDCSLGKETVLMIAPYYPQSRLPALIIINFYPDNTPIDPSQTNEPGPNSNPDGIPPKRFCFKMKMSFGDYFKSYYGCTESSGDEVFSEEEITEFHMKMFNQLISQLNKFIKVFLYLISSQYTEPVVRMLINNSFTLENDKDINSAMAVFKETMAKDADKLDDVIIAYFPITLVNPPSMTIIAKIYTGPNQMILTEIDIGNLFFHSAIPKYYSSYEREAEAKMIQVMDKVLSSELTTDRETNNFFMLEYEDILEWSEQTIRSKQEEYNSVIKEIIKLLMTNADMKAAVLETQVEYYAKNFLGSLLVWKNNNIGDQNVSEMEESDNVYELLRKNGDDDSFLFKSLKDYENKGLKGFDEALYKSAVLNNIYIFEIVVAFLYNAVVINSPYQAKLLLVKPNSKEDDNNVHFPSELEPSSQWRFFENSDLKVPNPNAIKTENEDPVNLWDYDSGANPGVELSKEQLAKWTILRKEFDFNYVLFIYGFAEINKKLSLKIFELQAGPLIMFKLIFKTEYFTWEYIYSFNTYTLLWEQFTEAVKEVASHYKEVSDKMANASDIYFLKSGRVGETIAKQLKRAFSDVYKYEQKDEQGNINSIMFYVSKEKVIKAERSADANNISFDQIPNYDPESNKDGQLFKIVSLYNSVNPESDHKYKLQIFNMKLTKSDREKFKADLEKKNWNKLYENQQYSFYDKYGYDYIKMVDKYISKSLNQLYFVEEEAK